MKKTIKPILMLLLVSISIFAEAQVPNHQDCLDAIPICQGQLSPRNSYSGTGNYPNEIRTQTSCLSTGERNDVWYIFTAMSNNQLLINLNPNNPIDDYDWAVFNLTNANCSQIFNNPALEISCNYSATTGATGTQVGATGSTSGQGGSPWNQPINVIQGQTYVINISNFSASQSGYNLQLAYIDGSNVNDNLPPAIASAEAVCNSAQIKVRFSENVLCSSVQGTDFTITGPGGSYTVTAVSGDACSVGAHYEDEYTLTVTPSLQPGNYSIQLSGNIQDICQNNSITNSFPFTINSSLTPTFNDLGPYCVGATPGTLPTTSINGITGTWNPATISTASQGSTTYTFTPTAGLCATTATMVVVVNPKIVPTFTQLGPYCVGATPGTLPTTSNNGITGIWYPATISTDVQGSATYTFTPTAGQCATTATLVVVVDPNIVPTFNAFGPYCVGATPGTLPTTSNNGITGTWNPSIVSTATQGTTTYTFTPTEVQCATTATMNIMVTPNPNVTVTSPGICNGTAQPVANGATSYTWTGGLASTSNPTTPVLTTTTTYTVTGTTNGCTGTAVSTVTVNNDCNCPTIILATSGNSCGVNPKTITGSFNNATQVSFAENGAGALNIYSTPVISTTSSQTPFTIIYTPTAAEANAGSTVTITVTIPALNGCPEVVNTYTLRVLPNNLTISVPPQSICPNTAVTLTASSTPADPTIAYTWTGGLTGNPATTPILTANAIYTVTGTSTTGCGTAIATVSIIPPPTISASSTSVCSGITVRLLASGASTYSWNTTPVSTVNPLPVTPTATTTYTVTGTTNGCSRTASMTITVDPNCGSCCANTCPWTLDGNGAINAVGRGTIGLTSTCGTNNYIGTRSRPNATESNDLVFGANGNGWMRLTTTGGLFLTDNTGTPTNGNIKIGMYAGRGDGAYGGTGNIFLGQNTARNIYDGGSNNYIIGTESGLNITSGSYNIIFGHQAARDFNNGGYNIILGYQAAKSSATINSVGSDNILIGDNVASESKALSNSIFIGKSAGRFVNTTNAAGNIGIGESTGSTLPGGAYNIFIGQNSGQNCNLSSSSNIFIGEKAGQNFSGSLGSICIGSLAGQNALTSCQDMTAVGAGCGQVNAGIKNSFFGMGAGMYNTTGFSNTFIGRSAGLYNISGSNNTYTGNTAGQNNTLGSNNSFYGLAAGINSLGSNNVSVGALSFNNTAGFVSDKNTVIGSNAGYIRVDGNENTIVGQNALSALTGNANTALGNNAGDKGNFNKCTFLGAETKSSGGVLNSTMIGYGAQCAKNDAIILGSNIAQTGIVVPFIGINTSAPSTQFHVNCLQTSYTANLIGASAIRFQDLQSISVCNSNVNDLVIDGNGYIFRKITNTNCPAARTAAYDSVYYQKTDSLLKRIEALETKLATLEKDMDKCCSKTTGNAVEDFPMGRNITLYQNVPNPFTIGTEIKFFIPETVQKASLVIYDLNGREIKKIDINERNESSVKIQGKELAPGMYIYTLIADNKEVDSKRMILTGN